jgi:bacterioferritin
MSSNKELIATLNKLASEEANAILQYVIHSSCAEDWGLKELCRKLMKTGKVEMSHLDSLIDRIHALDGEVEILIGKIKLGKNVKEVIRLSKEAEEEAIEHYNDAIIQAHDAKDNATNHILKEHEEDENVHKEMWSAEEYKLDQMGLETYLLSLVED